MDFIDINLFNGMQRDFLACRLMSYKKKKKKKKAAQEDFPCSNRLLTLEIDTLSLFSIMHSSPLPDTFTTWRLRCF